MTNGTRLMTATATLVFAAFALINRPASGADAPPATQPAAEWATLPPDKWPQLVLTNKASFDGHTGLNGASAFLVRMPDGEVMVGTAKHLIKEPGGVNPPVPLADLDKVLTRWQVFPRTKLDQVIDAKGLAETANRETRHDWLLLHLADRSAKLPAVPLVPRARPAEVGETVYLIGVPYTDKKSAQNVYKGVVVARPYKTYFKYEFTPPVTIACFSGAPIVDSHGLLLGHGVSKFELKKQDGLEIEFGGEDAAVALSLWQHRNDPPTTQPAALVRLDVPDGWVDKSTLNPNALRIIAIPDLVAYCELTAQPKADFADNASLTAWAKAIKETVTKKSKLANRRETDIKEGKIGDIKTIEYEVTGDSKNVTIRYRMIMFELNGCFCKLACWTTPTHWDVAQRKFEDVMSKIK